MQSEHPQGTATPPDRYSYAQAKNRPRSLGKCVTNIALVIVVASTFMVNAEARQA
jgi:hypothetical protein